MIHFKKLKGQEIVPFIDKIASLRIEIFAEFPYLYDGDSQYERKYLARYSNAETSLVILALDENEVIGVSTCLSLSEEEESFVKAHSKLDLPINKTIYFGESIIKKAFRGQKIGHKFFEFREAHALELGAEYVTFCAVKRELNHPMRPTEYKDLSNFWSRLGYKQTSENIIYAWKDHGEDKESEKELTLWVKKF